MSIQINHLFVETVFIKNITVDKFGQLIVTNKFRVNCRFREINRITTAGSLENNNNQSMIWLPADTKIKIGDLIERDDINFRITDVIKARRGGETGIDFLKCFVEQEK